MNWYIKAQLERTLPYFQELAEWGDYVPNPEKLHSYLKEHFNTEITKDIGLGDSGVAYLLSNGDVLKITTNSQEGAVAQWLISNPNPYIAEYKQVWKEGDLFYIIMEKVDPIPPSPLKEEIEKILMIVENNTDPRYSSTTLDSVIKFLEEQPSKSSFRITNAVVNYLKHLVNLSSIGIFDFLNIDNVGIKGDKLKFFDIT